jgi:hypothetical protein
MSLRDMVSAIPAGPFVTGIGIVSMTAVVCVTRKILDPKCVHTASIPAGREPSVYYSLRPQQTTQTQTTQTTQSHQNHTQTRRNLLDNNCVVYFVDDFDYDYGLPARQVKSV